MKKVLIDDNTVDGEGHKYLLYIYYYESGDPEVGDTTDDEILSSSEETILLELQFGNEIAVPGYELVRLKISPDGVKTIESRFSLAPDQAYSLYKHWQDIDDKIRIEDRDEDWGIQKQILSLLKKTFPKPVNIDFLKEEIVLTADELIYPISCLVRNYFVRNINMMRLHPHTNVWG